MNRSYYVTTETEIKINELLRKFPEKFQSKSHIVKCAIMYFHRLEIDKKPYDVNIGGVL